MTVEHIEVLVEEPSMEAALRELLPAIVGNTSFAIYQHQSKDQLLARLPNRLAGYKAWLPETSCVLVIVDRDDDDCRELKRRLDQMAADVGLATRSTGRAFQVLNRIAIEELEAWYFGDWTAVRAAYPRLDANQMAKAAFRDPDAIKGGTWEVLERLLQKKGYFATGLRKIEAARMIARHMDPARNTSSSFRSLCAALQE